MTMLRTCRLLLLLITVSNTAGAIEQQATYVEGGQSWIYLGPYVSRPITDLDDLPADIKTKLETHLAKRLGQDYFQRLSVSGGQIVDHEELYRINPRAKNYEWEVFAFRIGFRISEPEKGIKEFNGYIELERDGGILKDIEFPAVATAPWKGNFVSFASALETAENLGLAVARFQIKYSPREDVLMFVIQERIPRDELTGDIRIISINAHTGQVMNDDMGHYIR